jgi:hypothetical protein
LTGYVDAFKDAGVQGPTAVGEDAVQVEFEALGEST